MILLNGCSHVQGDDLEDKDQNGRHIQGTNIPYRASTLVENSLKIPVHNIAQNGFSCHSVFRTTISCLLDDLYKICVVVWPDPSRLEIPWHYDPDHPKISQRGLQGWRTVKVNQSHDIKIFQAIADEIKEPKIFDHKLYCYSTILQKLCKKLSITYIEWTINTLEKNKSYPLDYNFDHMISPIGWIDYGISMGGRLTSSKHFDRQSQNLFADKIIDAVNKSYS